MEKINFTLSGNNESNVFITLVSEALNKSLKSVNFIDKNKDGNEIQTLANVKYDVENLPFYNELQRFEIETFAYCSKVGKGLKTYYLAKRKTDNLTVFADIETLRKKFDISYNKKIDNVSDLFTVCENFVKAKGFTIEETMLDESTNGIFHFRFTGDFTEKVKEVKTSKLAQAQAEAEAAKEAAAKAEAEAAKLRELLAQMGIDIAKINA